MVFNLAIMHAIEMKLSERILLHAKKSAYDNTTINIYTYEDSGFDNEHFLTDQ